MKALVLSSGGIDSTTALAIAVDRYGEKNVISLSIGYGQKHVKELEAAKIIAEYYSVEHIFLDLSDIFIYSDCSILSHSNKIIPKKSYEKQIEESKGLKPVSTYVPFRNGLFLSSAASIALSKECGVIYYGAHKDDAVGSAYPDCSKKFQEAISDAIWEGTGGQLKVEAPFIDLNKSQIVKIGIKLKAPYKYSWSCYEGGRKPCGKCGTCIDRKLAFKKNGIEDPALI